MMRPLREEGESSDPLATRAVELLRAMRPLDVERTERPVLLPGQVARRTAAGRLRAGVGVAMTFITIGAAAATWRGVHHHAPGAPSSMASTPPARASVPGRALLPAPVDLSDDRSPPLALEPSVAAPAPSAVEPLHPRATKPPAPRVRAVTAPRARVTTPARSESELVLGAVRALRRDGDPALAGALASESLGRYPDGAQAEEASALVMEAAAARGDQAEARRAAGEYVDRYASGRFADRARRLLAAPPR